MTDHWRGSAVTGLRCSIKPGRGNYHLALAGCDDCNMRALRYVTLGRVEEEYQQGYIGQALFEAYMHVWATGAPRFSSLGDGWTDPPTDPEVAALVALFRATPVEVRGG
jgi:hypothetical protein